MKTVEEFLDGFEPILFVETSPFTLDSVILKSDVSHLMIEFAKMHVEAALKAASEQATNETDYHWNGEDEVPVTGDMDKFSILNAYPLTNIK